MIRPCADADFEVILEVINDAASAYQRVIPADQWHDPYMPAADLRDEMAAGVRFWAYEQADAIIGVMGVQDVDDVTLIRHAYVRTASRNQGIGEQLLRHLRDRSARPLLIGTWAAATWAIHFYERRGFQLVSDDERNRLLKRYWTVPPGQIAASVVLVDQRWLDAAL